MKRSFFILMLIMLLFSTQIHTQTWSALLRLTWNTGSSSSPAIARDSGTWIHVVWHDNTSGNYEIYYKRSLNSGTTWSPFKRLTWTAGTSVFPSIAIDSLDGVHVTWDDNSSGDYEVYYKHSSDGGTTWSTAKRMTWFRTQYGVQMGMGSSIAADYGDGIYIAWDSYETGNYEIYFKRSTDLGLTWSSKKRLTWNTGWSSGADLTVDISNNIHIVWDDNTPGNSEIFYKKSTDQGATWSALKRLTWNTDVSAGVYIAADLGGGIHITWTDKFPEQIFYKRSLDGGTTWSSRTQMTWTSDWSWSRDISALDTGIHVVWEEVDPDDSDIIQIRYKNSPDTGGSWLPIVQLTWNKQPSTSPSIAVDTSSGVHVVWSDKNPGNNEIFYKNRK